MFFVLFKGFLKPTTIQIFLQKFCQHPVSCPTTKNTEEKPPLVQPGCKTAVITGGTGAIGLAIANKLLCAKARKIALIDRDICKGKDAITSLNCAFGKDKSIFMKADVTKKMDIEDALRRIRGDFKQVDMIINTFGVWDEKKWEDEITVNLIGVLNINQVAKDIVTKPGGFVLNVIGLPGLEVFSPSPVLAASFNGVLAYTRSMGHEKNASHTGVRTVALCCGITQSNFSQDPESKVCCPQMGTDLKKYLKEASWQKPGAVAEGTIEVIKYAPSGTIWVVEGSRLFSIKLPDLVKTFSHLEKQFI